MAGVMGDINNNLMGLQQLAAGRQQIQQNQELAANNKLATENLRKYYSSEQAGNPDFAALQEAFLLSPDMSQRMLQGAGITDKRKGQDAASYAIEAYGAIDDPERFVDLTQKRIQYLQAQGRDASQSIGALEAYMGGKKEQVKNGTKLLLASLTNQGYLDKDVYGQLAGAEERARKAALEERAMKVDERQLASNAANMTSANIREIEYYNKMPEGPAKEAAGRKLGLLPNWGYDAENARAVAEAKAAGGVSGKGQAEAAIDLPKIESSATKVTGLVNELLNHKGKSAALGASSYLPSIRGTERAGFDNRLKQIQGDAFLKAFESLKGGGAITEMEGQKATQALNRMNETVNEEEFDAAAKDFISEVNRFKDIAAQRAKGGSPSRPEAAQGGTETAAQRLARLTSGK